MPQLIPDPWFSIFIYTWTLLILIFLPKTLNHKILNKPTLNKLHMNQLTWSWPWT